jgi:environmental stress-induced protein Ves
MAIQHQNFNKIQPTLWAGGKTFEYYIYPNTASYSKKDFLIRLSTATIESSPSQFTAFPDYHRYLIMLDNDLQIERDNKHINYPKGSVFEFPAQANITSFTTGTDFNVMVHESVNDIEINTTNSIEIAAKHAFILAVDYTIVMIHEKRYHLLAKDMLIVHQAENPKPYLIEADKATIICTWEHIAPQQR